MNDPRSTIADWLRDAHAMESNLINMLEKQAGRLEGFPDLQARISRHADESRRHASMVEECLESLNEDTSLLKDGIARLGGKLGPIGLAMAEDAPVKIVLANYAAENFEIACYRSLQAAAEHCGEDRIAAVMAEIIREEEIMADYLDGEIEALTVEHLEAEIAEASA